MSLKDDLRKVINESLIKNNIKYPEDNIIIETPKQEENGDYSSNIALVLAKQIHKNPLELANTIISNIESDIIENITVAPPGFINIKINKEYLLKEINKIISEGKNYGRNNTGLNKKINIEYVSANPTGTLHIGHGRGACYGDNLARILKFCGYDVTREYYINDAGNQMNNLGISIKERYLEQCGQPFSIPEDGYHGKEIITIAEEIYQKYNNTKINESTEYFKNIGLITLLDAIKKDLDKFRVNFDIFTSEQSLYDRGLVEKILDKLRKNNHCYIKEGALWLKTTDYQDEKDRVLIKNDGNYTYLLPDIAYHIDKYERKYEEIIDVFGADHHGYIPRLKSSLEMLGYNSQKLDIKILQMVRLLKDGEEIKISKRTGKTITLNDLIEEVGINATRYFFASKSLDTQMDFDIGLATKNSNENPVYYVEYANARISSIIKNYQEKIIPIENYKTIKEDAAYNIIKKLIKFKDTVITSAEKKQPHIICNYIYELATLFHSYYASQKFITTDEIYNQERMALLMAIKIVINNSLNLIGIIPREEM